MGNVHMEATQINYRGGSKKMSVEEAIKAAGTEITPEEKTWIDSIPTLASGKADNDVIAPEFDSEEGVYAIGDLVMHEGKLYEFTTAHETAGDWDSTEVTEKTVADELDSLKSGLNGLIGGTFSILRVVPTQQITQINYPSGHNKDNTVILTVGYKASDTYNDIFWASVMSSGESRYCYTDNGGIRLVVDDLNTYNRPHYIAIMKMTLPTE